MPYLFYKFSNKNFYVREYQGNVPDIDENGQNVSKYDTLEAFLAKKEGVDEAMSIIQERALTNELDYQFVMDCLKNYRSPRAKLTRLLKSGAINTP